ncbi:MAG TPA: 6,7-dimethyl-8-ribityllumazine synthase [Cytophagales bacterium]|nr:6,7-dimethyl-8-ribityllumazine synthase [Cytophagales bacterium]
MATVEASNLDFLYKSIVPVKPFKIAILTAKWNWEITGKLMEGAEEYLNSCGDIEIVKHFVPGAYELTIGAQKLAQQASIDAVVTLGCVIKGDTFHFDYICQAVAQGISNVGLKYDKPIIFGVLTTNTIQQAIDRAGGVHGNKGAEAAATAVQVLNEFLVEKKGRIGF